MAEQDNRGLQQCGSSANQTFRNDGTDNAGTINSLRNASAAAGAGKETASIALIGYPSLKGKGTIEITGVGKGSGKWYCKTVVHTWDTEHGYITTAELTRGDGGDGGGESAGGGGGDGTDPVPTPSK